MQGWWCKQLLETLPDGFIHFDRTSSRWARSSDLRIRLSQGDVWLFDSMQSIRPEWWKRYKSARICAVMDCSCPCCDKASQMACAPAVEWSTLPFYQQHQHNRLHLGQSTPVTGYCWNSSLLLNHAVNLSVHPLQVKPEATAFYNLHASKGAVNSLNLPSFSRTCAMGLEFVICYALINTHWVNLLHFLS